MLDEVIRHHLPEERDVACFHGVVRASHYFFVLLGHDGSPFLLDKGGGG
jgi:hypothetical protein